MPPVGAARRQRVNQVVDTVGAGDAFAVGAISALLDGLSPEAAMLRANLLGSRAVQVRGDMEGLPDRQTLTAIENGEAASLVS